MLPLCICLWHDFLAASVRLSYIICWGRGLESSGRRADRGSLTAQVWQLCSHSLFCRDLPHQPALCSISVYFCYLHYEYAPSHHYDTSSKEPSRSTKGRHQQETNVFFRALPEWWGGGGGGYPCPNFLALFQEVHFWSIKRVYFFKNANVLNF